MNKRIKKKRGLSKIRPEELWGLDVTLAKYILPRLIKFKEINTNSHPQELNNMKEWHDIIDKMIWSFQKIIKDDWSPVYGELGRENMRYLEGMRLFGYHFNDLWD